MKAVSHGCESRPALSAKMYRYISTDLAAEGMDVEGGQEAEDEKSSEARPASSDLREVTHCFNEIRPAHTQCRERKGKLL